MALFPPVLYTRAVAVFTVLAYLIHRFWGYTVQTLIESLWGADCLVCKWWASCAQTKYPLIHSHPVQKSTIETTSVELPSKLDIVHVGQIYDGASRVSSHCTLSKVLYRPTIRCRQVCRLSHTSKASGVVLFHCSVKLWYLHGSWFLVVHVLSGAGWSWPARDPSFARSGEVNSGLTSPCCFSGKSGRLSGWLLVGPLASSPLSAGGTGVGLSLVSTSYHWIFIFCLSQVVTNR